MTSRSHRIAILIPASPNDGFYSQLAMYRLALDALGGQYRDARLIATIGAPVGTTVPERWRPHLERVSVRFVPVDTSGRYRTQVFGRWNGIPPDTEVALFADADTLPLRPFDELLDQVVDEGAITGTIAHAPLRIRDARDPREGWSALARQTFGGSISLDHTTTLPPDPTRPVATPFYVNYGAVFMPLHVCRTLRVPFLDIASCVEPHLVDPWFAGQAALALAVAQTRVPRLAVDLRYNFPNDPRADALYPDGLEDIRIIHYLRTGAFDRQRIFADRDGFDAFLAQPLAGSNAAFQQRVRDLTGGVYPFA